MDETSHQQSYKPVFSTPIVQPITTFDPAPVQPAPVLSAQPVFQDEDPFAGVMGVTAPPVPAPSVSHDPDSSGTAAQEPQNDRVSYADAAIEEIDITKIIPNPYQPRKVFRPEALQELSDSIREHGVIQPLVVTETANGYEIVVGERRFRASIMAGLAKVPAIVKKSLEDQTKLEVALIENIQRQELNPIEEAQAYDRLIKTFHLTQEQVAKKVGKSRPAITNTIRLLNLPAEIQRAIIEGKITEGHGRAILGLPDTEKQLLMFKTILEQGWNVRQVETKVRELSARRQLDAVAPDPKLMALESELRGKFGTQVKIQRQGKGGKILIEFFSEEELDDIIQRVVEERANAVENEGFITV